ncbi:MAG: DUF1003 domain-containing protein, partial [Candidatus Nanopelagicales bacterium]
MVRESGRRADRLDQPLEPRRSLRPAIDTETFGKASERIARFIGSWRFIAYMTAFVAVWVLWNVLLPESVRFDPWPFIGLTLMLSLQASYAAPLILLAQNRQADRDRVTYLDDRARGDRLIADTHYVTRELASLRLSMGDLATRDFLRSELRDLLEELLEEDAVARRERKAKKRRRLSELESGLP